MIESVFDYTLNNFNFGYVISINLISYFIIQIINYFKKSSIPKVFKIGITIIVSISMFLLYRQISDIPIDILINSSILAPVAWDWIIKPICKLLKIDYNNGQTLFKTN